MMGGGPASNHESSTGWWYLVLESSLCESGEVLQLEDLVAYQIPYSTYLYLANQLLGMSVVHTGIYPYFPWCTGRQGPWTTVTVAAILASEVHF